MQSSRRTLMLDVDLGAIRHNVDLVRTLAGKRELIASVKANAYGFGAVGVSRELVAAGIRKLWTGNLDEAVAMRDAGIEADILLFGGIAPEQFGDLLRHDLQPTIFDAQGLLAAVAAAGAAGRRMPVWIKVDAGLGRLGVDIEGAQAFIGQVARTPALDLRGVYTHLPFASAGGRQWALDRHGAFRDMIRTLGERGVAIPTTQVWASSGLLADLPDESNAVCVGHALFGLNPLEPGVGGPVGLRPAIRSLSAGVLRVNDRGAGSGGYGRAQGARGATIAIGLGDGLRKAGSDKAHVIVGNTRAPVRAFTLEHLMVDLTPEATVGLFDRAIVIGQAGGLSISLKDWAEWTASSELEVMMSLSGRTPVSYG